MNTAHWLTFPGSLGYLFLYSPGLNEIDSTTALGESPSTSLRHLSSWHILTSPKYPCLLLSSILMNSQPTKINNLFWLNILSRFFCQTSSSFCLWSPSQSEAWERIWVQVSPKCTVQLCRIQTVKGGEPVKMPYVMRDHREPFHRPELHHQSMSTTMLQSECSHPNFCWKLVSIVKEFQKVETLIQLWLVSGGGTFGRYLKLMRL